MFRFQVDEFEGTFLGWDAEQVEESTAIELGNDLTIEAKDWLEGKGIKIMPYSEQLSCNEDWDCTLERGLLFDVEADAQAFGAAFPGGSAKRA